MLLIQITSGQPHLALDMMIMTFQDDWLRQCSRADTKMLPTYVEPPFWPGMLLRERAQVRGHWNQGQETLRKSVNRLKLEY